MKHMFEGEPWIWTHQNHVMFIGKEGLFCRTYRTNICIANQIINVNEREASGFFLFGEKFFEPGLLFNVVFTQTWGVP